MTSSLWFDCMAEHHPHDVIVHDPNIILWHCTTSCQCFLKAVTRCWRTLQENFPAYLLLILSCYFADTLSKADLKSCMIKPEELTLVREIGQGKEERFESLWRNAMLVKCFTNHTGRDNIDGCWLPWHYLIAMVAKGMHCPFVADTILLGLVAHVAAFCKEKRWFIETVGLTRWYFVCGQRFWHDLIIPQAVTKRLSAPHANICTACY